MVQVVFVLKRNVPVAQEAKVVMAEPEAKVLKARMV